MAIIKKPQYKNIKVSVKKKKIVTDNNPSPSKM